MKRKGNIYAGICSMDNLVLAEKTARKGKAKQYGVQQFDLNRDQNLQELHEMLVNRTYRNSPYTIFTIREPKVRQIFRLPYYPDRVIHHAAMIPLERIFVDSFTADTYSCIKGRGIHGMKRNLERALKDVQGTQYALQLDIVKFYPSVDHDILKSQLRRKIKDKDLLWLLDEIIDSADGLPIGNYLSQYLANFYLSPFDHFLKEVLRVKYYFRYADDMLLLARSAKELHRIVHEIIDWLRRELKLEVKVNWRIFPVRCGINIIGYIFRHTHTLLRPGIKHNFARKIKKNKGKQTIASYIGWAVHCNSIHLLKKLLPDEQFQRTRNRYRKKLYRTKGKPGRHHRRTDNSTFLSNREKQV
jgi:RNA-directed DNA polymerase